MGLEYLKDKELTNIDILFWIGKNSLYIWDKKEDRTGIVEYIEKNDTFFPYCPKFSSMLQNISYYQNKIRLIVQRRFLYRYCIMAAVPEDLNKIEKRALEDILYQLMNRRVKSMILCSQNLLLSDPKEDFLSITQTCRCFCIGIVKTGGLLDKRIMDIHQSGREEFMQMIQHLHQENEYTKSLSIYYSHIEEDDILPEMGNAVSFQEIRENFISYF